MKINSLQFAKHITLKKGVTLREIYFYLKSKISVVLITMAIFIAIAVLRSSTLTDEYESTSKILPENQNASNTSMGLAAILGGGSRNMLQQNNGMPPELYPSIVLSNQFLSEILTEEFYFNNLSAKMKLGDFLLNYDDTDLLTKAFRLPTIIFGFLKSSETPAQTDEPSGEVNIDSARAEIESSVLEFTPDQVSNLSKLRERITIVKDPQLFTISVKMPDPKVAALINQMIVERLTAFLIKYQTGKEQKNFDFISIQLEEAHKNYIRAQSALAAYRNQNRGMVNNLSMSRQEQLQTDYQLAENVYTNLAQQLEQARIKVQEARPVIGILEPPMVPLTKATPTPTKTIVIFALVGIFVGIVIIFGQLLWALFKVWITEEGADDNRFLK